VSLTQGPNLLRATAAGASTTQTVTRADTTAPKQPGVAEFGFGTALHASALERICQGCHELNDAALRDGGSMNGSTCTSCHDFGTRAKLHGPVGQGACLACHDARSEPRYAVRWPIQETCFQCHVDVQAAMNAKAFRHGPAAAGRCTTCHDPHGSDQPFWLKKRAFDLCTTCHTEKKTERHVVVGFVYGDSHPLQNRPHPLKPNTEFACPACHNPHAAQARFLWQFDATRRETLCRTCHQK
jgi:predicted CXXCH cytochrome family protein